MGGLPATRAAARILRDSLISTDLSATSQDLKLNSQGRPTSQTVRRHFKKETVYQQRDLNNKDKNDRIKMIQGNESQRREGIIRKPEWYGKRDLNSYAYGART